MSILTKLVALLLASLLIGSFVFATFFNTEGIMQKLFSQSTPVKQHYFLKIHQQL
jgi:hypothetical protein